MERERKREGGGRKKENEEGRREGWKRKEGRKEGDRLGKPTRSPSDCVPTPTWVERSEIEKEAFTGALPSRELPHAVSRALLLSCDS